MQKGFLNAHAYGVVPSVVRLIEECQSLGIPIVFTRFVNPTNSPFERLLDWSGVKSPPETDIVDELAHFGRIEIVKNFYTSLTDKMRELCRTNGWTSILICGVSTESCVLKTALDVFESGFTPIVITDACRSDAGEAAHLAGIRVLEITIGKRQLITSAGLRHSLAI